MVFILTLRKTAFVCISRPVEMKKILGVLGVYQKMLATLAS